MKILDSSNSNFDKDLKSILKIRFEQKDNNVDEIVKNIISEVVKKGDEALFFYANKFDKTVINSSNILLSDKIRKSYKDKIDLSVMDSFKVAIKNITNFHKKQIPLNYEIDNDNNKTSSIWKPIQSVGLYIPGGKSAYPSSLIMNIVPAIVAGVKRIVITTPSYKNIINPYILALLDEFSVDEVYQIGGAHAIAALAYGTESIEAVNKIFGPGNSYVSTAKKEVFGKVGIDLIAGPSEIIVVADNDNNPEWVAADLLAQAEHDENAQSILITDQESFAEKVILSINKFIDKLPRKEIIKKSLSNFGLAIISNNFNDACKIIDTIAPEHLHLQNKSYFKILDNVNNAGAIFIGEYSSEAFGDYIIGTNHILPTFGSAKFSSGLGVLDFMKRTSVVQMNSKSYEENQINVSKMAEIESLEAHKLSVKIRQIKKK